MDLQPQTVAAPSIATRFAPDSRLIRLREMYWDKGHLDSVDFVPITGCGEDSLVGHARDFVALLEASRPFIQPGELIVGSCLAIPLDPDALDLGYYNSHYPPGLEMIIKLGYAGIRDQARAQLAGETDPEKRDFLEAVAISYEGACQYAARYADMADELAEKEPEAQRRRELGQIAEVCREAASGPPSTLHSALQLFQFTRVLGGKGCIGRFDQWMYPFYRADLDAGRLTHDEAQELIDCLFLKMNEFGDGYPKKPPVDKRTPPFGTPYDDLRNIALAGQTPEGEDACNDLTYMCLEASAKIMLPEPKLNVRFFAGTPRRLLVECAQVLASGANTLAIFNDDVAVPGLMRLGVPVEDARDYCNDGCSELIIGGKGTISFRVHDALTVLTETVLEAREQPETFDDLMASFKEHLTPSMVKGAPDDVLPVTFPFFAASIQDCLVKASTEGSRYPILGSILAEVGNTADGMAAIKKLVYEDGVLAWSDLVDALRNDFVGHEPLRQMLLNRAPKYGNDDDYVDSLAKEIAETFADGVHASACNPTGYGVKRAPGFMSFGIHRKSDLPASPDGRRMGDLTANSFSPAVGMDRSGPTAVLKSVSKVDLTKASHGSVLDVALHSSVFGGEEGLSKLMALIDSFLRMGGTTTLQLNVIDRDTLLKARANPNAPEYRTLVVRVWGFSAVFVELPSGLQDHVLARTEHGMAG